MKVLILGGTGAIGKYLVELMASENTVFVTSCRQHENHGNIKYICGNAHDISFISEVCSEKWDAIVDFMSYKTEEFKARVDIFLRATKQYVYISSARVYGDNEHPIKESSPRLLDVINDDVYLQTDEYALTKARQENILLTGQNQNYTIVRPYITYGTYRYQLGVMEKEEWLYRGLHGRTILLPQEMLNCTTTMTYGYDVAYGIYRIVGNIKTLGEVFHITNKHLLKWYEVFAIYRELIQDKNGHQLRMKEVSTDIFLKLRPDYLIYQLKYDRLYDRDFDTTKETEFADADKFLTPKEGLSRCLAEFLKEPHWRGINWVFEAKKDKVTHERTPLSEIVGFRNRIKYLINRYIK